MFNDFTDGPCFEVLFFCLAVPWHVGVQQFLFFVLRWTSSHEASRAG